MKTIKEFWDKVDKSKDCWEWLSGKNKGGYGQHNFNNHQTLSHRVSYELKHGPIPYGLCVLHSCDNPGCVNPNHLFLGTHQDNSRDMANKNRHVYQKGEANRNSILCEVDIHLIRSLAKTKTYAAIAKWYSINGQTVSDISNHKRWSHILCV